MQTEQQRGQPTMHVQPHTIRTAPVTSVVDNRAADVYPDITAGYVSGIKSPAEGDPHVMIFSRDCFSAVPAVNFSVANYAAAIETAAVDATATMLRSFFLI